jgi:putative transcriptional regulator
MNIKYIRNKLNLSQEAFASSFGFTVHQIKNWEQGRSQPHGGLKTYLGLIGYDPEGIRQLVRREAAE